MNANLGMQNKHMQTSTFAQHEASLQLKLQGESELACVVWMEGSGCHGNEVPGWILEFQGLGS